jgi:hypothetical protein
MTAEYKISSALVGSGGSDLLIGSSYQYGASRENGTGIGITSLNLSITDNGSSILNQTFSSYAAFAAYVATATELTNAKGNQDIVVSLSETLSSANGAGWYYSLALAANGTTGGSFRTEFAVASVPLPTGLTLMLSGLPMLLWGNSKRKKAAA